MLLGPNGCGKSTLLKVLGGLLPGYSGLIDSDGPSGFVFQNPDHQVVMPTVAADVAFGLGRQVLVMMSGLAHTDTFLNRMLNMKQDPDSGYLVKNVEVMLGCVVLHMK